MNDNNLNFSIVKPNGMPERAFMCVIEEYERKLAQNLYREISDGDIYSVQIKHKIESNGISTSHVCVRTHTEKVRVAYFEQHIPPKIGWGERLHILLTGELPAVWREKSK